jgi:integrase
LPKTNLTFLVNGRGTPFTHGYNRSWRKWIAEAGLEPRCVPHGLRKAGMDRFAAAGWTVHEIAAWSGHQTLAEVERYTKKYDRVEAARRGAAKIIAKTGT